LRAEDAVRKAEKKAEAERKEKEMKILMGGAKKREEEKRAKDLAEHIRSWEWEAGRMNEDKGGTRKSNDKTRQQRGTNGWGQKGIREYNGR
jgi:hypothetical protein